VESELGLIPEGWEVKPLDQVADYLNGLALQKFPPESDSDFLPVIKIAQLKKGDTEGADRASSKLKPEYVVNDGDVLFSWSGSLAVDIWTGGPGALNQHLFKVTSANYPKWFYLYWTKFHLFRFQSIAADKAVTMGHIQRKHLTEALCVVPPLPKIKQLDSLIALLLGQQIERRMEVQTLATLRDTLLHKLLSGEMCI
jgi:type I restriction enzyme S subunit